jgi:hypothetical protein
LELDAVVVVVGSVTTINADDDDDDDDGGGDFDHGSFRKEAPNGALPWERREGCHLECKYEPMKYNRESVVQNTKQQ